MQSSMVQQYATENDLLPADDGAGAAELSSKLDKLFFPQSLALIGASDTPGKWGFSILLSMMGGGYEGRIYPVNPARESILGLKAYASVSEIPEAVDLAIFTIPARKVPDGLRECVASGIQSAVIISSGFKEAGDEGAALEREIVAIARQGGLIFIGPNTMGIASAHQRLEAIPAPSAPEAGGLAMISQSGNLGLQLLKWVSHREIGLSFYAGTGNEAGLKASQLLDYCGSRPEVKAIAMYMEGIENGREFMEVAGRVTREKPVVVLKTGRSSSGSQAAASHTGSMAGSYATYCAMFRQTGVTQVRTPMELINVATAMTHLPIPRSNRVAIMTMGGGWGVIAADECEDSGLVLPALSPWLIADLDKQLPDYWNRGNPVDVVGEGDPDLYLHVIEALARWDEVDAVIALGVVGRSMYVQDSLACQEKVKTIVLPRDLKQQVLKEQLKSERRILSEVARIQGETGKPVVVVTLNENGLTVTHTGHGSAISLSSPDEAVSIIAHMARYGGHLQGR